MAIKTAIRLAGKHPFFWVALFIGVVLLGFYVFAGLMIYRYGTLSKDFGWEYNSRGDQWYVSGVDPNDVAAGKLETGSIDGNEWITRIGNDLNLHLKTEALPVGSENDDRSRDRARNVRLYVARTVSRRRSG